MKKGTLPIGKQTSLNNDFVRTLLPSAGQFHSQHTDLHRDRVGGGPCAVQDLPHCTWLQHFLMWVETLFLGDFARGRIPQWAMAKFTGALLEQANDPLPLAFIPRRCCDILTTFLQASLPLRW